MVFLLYFSQWLVIDLGVADFWYNSIFVVATLMLLLSAPLTSAVVDKSGAKVPYWIVTTLLQFLFLLLAGILASYLPTTSLIIVLVVSCYALSNYLHQFALVFYNALLIDVSFRGTEGFISGLGQFARWLGTIVGVAVGIPFAHSAFRLLGHSGRSQTFLPAIFASLLITAPSLLLKSPPVRAGGRLHIAVLDEVRSYSVTFRRLWSQPGVARYLVALFLFNDAMLTVQHNMPIYMQQVLHLPDKTKSLILGGMFVFAAVGALISGRVSDRIGHRRSLIGILVSWTVFLPLLSTIKAVPAFVLLMSALGLLLGATWTVTRAVMAYLAPTDQMNHAFSFYTLAERFATVVGPLAWGAIATGLLPLGAARYRAALFCMGIFVLVGLIIAWKIPAQDQMPIEFK